MLVEQKFNKDRKKYIILLMRLLKYHEILHNIN